MKSFRIQIHTFLHSIILLCNKLLKFTCTTIVKIFNKLIIKTPFIHYYIFNLINISIPSTLKSTSSYQSQTASHQFPFPSYQ